MRVPANVADNQPRTVEKGFLQGGELSRGLRCPHRNKKEGRKYYTDLGVIVNTAMTFRFHKRQDISLNT